MISEDRGLSVAQLNSILPVSFWATPSMGKDLYLWAYFHNLAIQTAPAASAQTITQLLLTENPL